MIQSAIALVYPHQCATCETPVARRGGLCGSCWRDTPFIDGSVCDTCGTPLQGDATGPSCCDACLVRPRPWNRGRAAVLYSDRGRQVVLQIKHSDRLDLVPAAAAWMAPKVAELAREDSVLVPVPSHWTRILKRRFNQAALLSGAVARLLSLDHAPRSLIRVRSTQTARDKSLADRIADLEHSMRPHPRHGRALDGRGVILIDDVMTSGATLAAATDAARAAGAARVDMVVLARVAKDA